MDNVFQLHVIGATLFLESSIASNSLISGRVVNVWSGGQLLALTVKDTGKKQKPAPNRHAEMVNGPE